MTIIEEINATFSASEEEKKKLKRSFRKEPFFKKAPVWEPCPNDVKKHYKELEKRLKSGNIPEEWQKIWSDIREIVRYLFLKDPAAIPQCTALKIDVTSSYYYKYFILSLLLIVHLLRQIQVRCTGAGAPKAPLCKGSCHANSVTEGLTTPPSRRSAAHLPLHRGGFGTVQTLRQIQVYLTVLQIGI